MFASRKTQEFGFDLITISCNYFKSSQVQDIYAFGL